MVHNLNDKEREVRAKEAEAQALISLPQQSVTPAIRNKIAFLEAEVSRLRAELREARQRVSELIELADQDPLIEIMNRRAFIRELSRVMASVERYDFEANLVYVDLNGLKAINDVHGHAAGDAVLKHVGETIAAQIRQTDAVGRLGGDEFGLLLTHTSKQFAELKMDQLAKGIGSKPLVWKNSTLTASISYGVFPLVKGQEAEDALHSADRAMYEYKRAVNG